MTESDDTFILSEDEAAAWFAATADGTVLEIPPGPDAQLDRSLLKCHCGHVTSFRGHEVRPVYICAACGAEYIPKKD